MKILKKGSILLFPLMLVFSMFTACSLFDDDMSGNVWEWNFDWHPDSGCRVFRGGSWSWLLAHWLSV
jgi:hypothetical protein